MSTAERYREAGVDLDAADLAKQRIADMVARARTELARGRIGAFGGMVALPAGMSKPVLVMSTDGVGTKVLVAIRAGRHDTVGEDLVNHAVNDILVHGALPIAFQDYIAAAGVAGEVIAALVHGVARGCQAHRMTLAGGETAQLPDLYEPGHYDLAGTIVGVVEEDRAIHGERVRAGDVLVGYASSGLHTNGYTLARRIVFDVLKLDLAAPFPDTGLSVAEALLAVHRSYYGAIFPVVDRMHALAHITGGGIPGNLPRVLPEGLGARIETGAWEVPAIFRVLQDAGRVSREEMFRVFNMGIGMIAVVGASDVAAVQRQAEQAGVATWVIGTVVAGDTVRLDEP